VGALPIYTRPPRLLMIIEGGGGEVKKGMKWVYSKFEEPSRRKKKKKRRDRKIVVTHRRYVKGRKTTEGNSEKLISFSSKGEIILGNFRREEARSKKRRKRAEKRAMRARVKE